MSEKAKENKLTVGIPTGSLRESTEELFQRAGYSLSL